MAASSHFTASWVSSYKGHALVNRDMAWKLSLRTAPCQMSAHGPNSREEFLSSNRGYVRIFHGTPQDLESFESLFGEGQILCRH